MRVLCSVAMATIMLAGCAGGMIPGQIVSEQGRSLDFQIEKARRSGRVAAFDPSTGETFAGTYVGILESVGGSRVSFGSNGGIQASSFGLGSNIANAQAILTGDRGTTLTCEMKIESSFDPHGIGGCTDNKATRYRLQF